MFLRNGGSSIDDSNRVFSRWNCSFGPIRDSESPIIFSIEFRHEQLSRDKNSPWNTRTVSCANNKRRLIFNGRLSRVNSMILYVGLHHVCLAVRKILVFHSRSTEFQRCFCSQWSQNNYEVQSRRVKKKKKKRTTLSKRKLSRRGENKLGARRRVYTSTFMKKTQ